MCSSTWPSWRAFLFIYIHCHVQTPQPLTVFFKQAKHCIISTCEGVFPLQWACRSWRLAPSCWPAGPPRPWSCGCSSLEEFLPRGSSETHLLLESGKAWGHHILLIINNNPLPNNFLRCAFELSLLFFTTVQKETLFNVLFSSLTHVTQSRRFSRAAMCRGESPWMLTACRSQWAFRSSSAMSTLPENAAQWRQMFSS